MDVTVTGSIFDGLAEVIAKLMKGPISDEIEAVVEMELNKNIPKILNKKILLRDGIRMPLKAVYVFNQVQVDTSVPHAWVAKKTGLEIGVSSYSFNQFEIEPTPAELGDQQTPAMTAFDPANTDIV